MLFEESGISPDVAAERGYYTARRRAEVPKIFKGYQRKPGLVVPMFSPDGETVGYQLRPDKPRRNGPKYETPGGISPVVDVHPRMLEEVRHGAAPLLITEGAKTGDAPTSRGIPTVVLAGVWMWCVPGARPYRLKPCFDHVRLEGREVFVAFDSDCMSKAGVQDALAALVAALEARGAVVKVIYLPDAADGSKQGVDDYLAGGGTVRGMFMLARKFAPADIGRIRLSRDANLKSAVGALWARWWTHDWARLVGTAERPNATRGRGVRDSVKVLIDRAARHGTPTVDGVQVKASTRTLALEAATSRPTLGKALKHAEAEGLLRIEEAAAGDEARSYVLLVPAEGRGNLYHQGHTLVTGALRCPRRPYPPGKGFRGSPDVPRLRWSSPGRKPKRGTVRGTRKVRQGPPPKPRESIIRLGKARGAIIDALEVNGGAMHVNEIAEALHYKHPRDLARRKKTPKGKDGPLVWLEDDGLVTVEGGTVSLADGWRERLQEVREAGKEIAGRAGEPGAAERDADDYRRQREAYRRREENPPDHHFANVGADGFIEDLEPAGAPRPTAAEALVTRIMGQNGRVRLGLLREIAAEEGLGWMDVEPAVRRMGYRVERLPEFGNREFVYADTSAA